MKARMLCGDAVVRLGLVLAFLGICGAAYVSILRAQEPLPQTLPLTNNKGETIGTVTIAGSRMVLRNSNGEILAQIVREGQDRYVMYDEHGNVLDQIKPLERGPR
jgi:hypothetical protein